MKRISATLLSLSLIVSLSACGQQKESSMEESNEVASSAEQGNVDLLARTAETSRAYLKLRLETDAVLVQAEAYPDYATWNGEMSRIINGWEKMEKDADELARQAESYAIGGRSFRLIRAAQAFEGQTVSEIYDKAPAGKKIATLAKHLGVDAKKAFAILKQDQAQVEADAWNEAGDTFQKLETSAVVIKDGCKVAGFVGGVVLSGGVSALAAGSTMAQAGVVIGGADLVLEVTDDAARIALGNHNKVSAIANAGRLVTEPLASVLSIAEVPEKLGDGFGKFTSTILALDQFNSAAQDGKIVGVALPAYAKERQPAKVTVLDPAQLPEWLKENDYGSETMSEAELKEVLGLEKGISREPAASSDAVTPAAENAIKDEAKPQVDTSIGSAEMSDGGGVAKDFDLVLVTQAASNDYQANIRTRLFAVPIEIRDGRFAFSNSASFGEEAFSGSANASMEGEYDAASGQLKGSYRYGWDGQRKGKSEQITYSGSFSEQLVSGASEVKLRFRGTIETIKEDGTGKPYSNTSEGGPSMVFSITAR